MDALKIISEAYCNDETENPEKLAMSARFFEAQAEACEAAARYGLKNEKTVEADLKATLAATEWEKFTFEQGVLTGLRLVGEVFRDAGPSAKGGTHS